MPRGTCNHALQPFLTESRRLCLSVCEGVLRAEVRQFVLSGFKTGWSNEAVCVCVCVCVCVSDCIYDRGKQK